MSNGIQKATSAGDSVGLAVSAPIALVDLDGTLCDCAGAIARALAEMRGPNEDPRAEEAEDPAPHIVARQRLIMSAPGFWRNLDPLPLGFHIFEVLEEAGFQSHILTKGPANQSLGWMEKVDWCRHHVPKLPIIMAEEKGLVYGKVLVDDWPGHIASWINWQPRGLVIVPAQPWNAGIETDFPDNSIRYDGSNLDALSGRLQSLV